jgi:pimeloyl-ACP methyl ester carboxylesterase
VRGALAHHLLTRTEGPALAAALALMLRLDARVLPPRLAVRVIEGEGDRLLPAGIDPAWLAANDIRRHRLPRSGHAPLVADPAAVAATLAASGAGAEPGVNQRRPGAPGGTCP